MGTIRQNHFEDELTRLFTLKSLKAFGQAIRVVDQKGKSKYANLLYPKIFGKESSEKKKKKGVTNLLYCH